MVVFTLEYFESINIDFQLSRLSACKKVIGSFFIVIK